MGAHSGCFEHIVFFARLCLALRDICSQMNNGSLLHLAQNIPGEARGTRGGGRAPHPAGANTPVLHMDHAAIGIQHTFVHHL